jgi:hypothetical protein
MLRKVGPGKCLRVAKRRRGGARRLALLLSGESCRGARSVGPRQCCRVGEVRAGGRQLAGTPCLAEYLPHSFMSNVRECTASRRSACPFLILCRSATSGRMGTGAASLRADWLGGSRLGRC